MANEVMIKKGIFLSLILVNIILCEYRIPLRHEPVSNDKGGSLFDKLEKPKDNFS